MDPGLICLCPAGSYPQNLSQSHLLLYHCLEQLLRLLKLVAMEQAWKRCPASP